MTKTLVQQKADQELHDTFAQEHAKLADAITELLKKGLTKKKIMGRILYNAAVKGYDLKTDNAKLLVTVDAYIKVESRKLGLARKEEGKDA